MHGATVKKSTIVLSQDRGNPVSNRPEQNYAASGPNDAWWKRQQELQLDVWYIYIQVRSRPFRTLNMSTYVLTKRRVLVIQCSSVIFHKNRILKFFVILYP